MTTPRRVTKQAAHKTNLQYYRQQKNLTQVELAHRARVNLRTLQDYEQGRKNINSAQTATVSRLAEVLGVPLANILEPTNKEQKNGIGI